MVEQAPFHVNSIKFCRFDLCKCKSASIGSDHVALHEIVLDDPGNPVDFIFLQANRAFEKHTGMRVADIPGRRVTQAIPDIRKTDLIQTFGKVALTGEAAEFDMFFEPLQRHYHISAYQIANRRFAVVFEDITLPNVQE